MNGACAAARPPAASLARAAVDAAEKPASRPDPLVSMVDGGLSAITPPVDVPVTLDISRRRFGSR
jgi:hypothetical protein